MEVAESLKNATSGQSDADFLLTYIIHTNYKTIHLCFFGVAFCFSGLFLVSLLEAAVSGSSSNPISSLVSADIDGKLRFI